MQGYIKTYRKLMNSPVWQEPHYLKLWMYCLLKATHKEHNQLVGNQLVKLKPGDFITGRKVLADDLNNGMKPQNKQSELSWWRYLNNLEKWEMLNIKKTNKYSVVSIIKWCEYQESEQQLNNNRTTNEQQLNTNNNVKNVKNVKNGNKKDSRSKLIFETKHMQLAELLFKFIKQNNPKAKEPNFKQWADTFRKMIELDNREGKDIQEVIIWCQKDSFWHTNILSADKLRTKFDELYLKMNNKPKQQEPTGRYIPDFDEIDLTAGED